MKATSLLPPRPAAPATFLPKLPQPCGRRKVPGPRNTVNKADLAVMLAKAGVVPSIAAGKLAITELCERIAEVLKSGRRVELRGFGTFRARVKTARGGLVRRDGSVIPASTVRLATFKFSHQHRTVTPIES